MIILIFFNLDCNSELSDRLWDYSHLPQPLSPDFRVFLFASHICIIIFFPCICQRLYGKVSETLESGTLGEGEAIGIIPFKMALEWKPTPHSFLSAARAWVASLGHMCPAIIICLIRAPRAIEATDCWLEPLKPGVKINLSCFWVGFSQGFCHSSHSHMLG